MVDLQLHRTVLPMLMSRFAERRGVLDAATFADRRNGQQVRFSRAVIDLSNDHFLLALRTLFRTRRGDRRHHTPPIRQVFDTLLRCGCIL